MATGLIELAREHSGLTQAALAEMAGTSRTTLNAYERGRKFPTAATLERILDAAGYELAAVPRPDFQPVPGSRGAEYWVATRLWRLPVRDALRHVTLPLHLDWSSKAPCEFDLRNRRERARCYEIVLREGRPDDIVSMVDGCLLVDGWDDLFLPAALRTAWADTIDRDLA